MDGGIELKKKGLYILIAVLTVSQFISILKINNLQRQIEYTSNQMNNLDNNIRNDMNSIYNNVDDMLNRKASLIETSTIEIGTINLDSLTVPITFNLTPKEVSEYTIVTLDFNGELFPMNKNDTTFSITVSRSIFADALPKIVINENGIKKTMDDKQIGILSIKDEIFPAIYPRLLGQASFNGNTYIRKGNLSADVKEVETDIKYTEMRLAIKVDDKLISEETIPNEEFYSGYEVDEKIPLSNGQICTMTVIAIDSIGLEHHYTVDTWVAGFDSQREPLFENEYIYSGDGKLLWKSEDTRLY